MRQASTLLLLAAIVGLCAGLEYLLPTAPRPNYGKAQNCPGTDKYIFPARTAQYGQELYYHEAIAGGTGETAVQLLKDMSTGPTDTNFGAFAPLASAQKLVFIASTLEQGTALWITDCTPTGTKVLYESQLGTSSDSLTNVIARPDGSEVLFGTYDSGLNRYVIKATNGTGSRTVVVLNNYDFFNAATSYNTMPVVCMGSLFLPFSNTTSPTYTGTELWRYDFATDYFSIVVDTYPGSGSGSPRNLMCHNDQYLIWTGYNSSYYQFAFDGENVTTLVANAFPNTGTQPRLNFQNRAYLVDNNRFRFFESPDTGFPLVANQPNFPSVANSAVFNGFIYFHEREYNSITGGYNWKVYKFDGLEFVQVALPSGRPNVGNIGITPYAFVPTPKYGAGTGIVGFFIGGHATGPTETIEQPLYWIGIKNDDTMVDVAMISDYSDCLNGYSTFQLALDYSGGVVLAHFTPTQGQVLLKVTGATATATLYLDLTPGPDYSFEPSYISSKAIIGGRFIFPLWTSEFGSELWWTDGTTAALLKDLYPGCGGSEVDLSSSAVINGELFFQATTPALGYNEFFATKGTAETTRVALETISGDNSDANYVFFCDSFCVYTGSYPDVGESVAAVTTFSSTVHIPFEGYITNSYCSYDGASAIVSFYNYSDYEYYYWKATVSGFTPLDFDTYNTQNDYETLVFADGIVGSTGDYSLMYRTGFNDTTYIVENFPNYYISVQPLDDHTIVFKLPNETDPLRLWTYNLQTKAISAHSLPYPLWNTYLNYGTFAHNGKFYYLSYDNNDGTSGWVVTDFTEAGTKKLWDWATEQTYFDDDHYHIANNALLIFSFLDETYRIRKFGYTSLVDGGFGLLPGTEDTNIYGSTPTTYASIPGSKLVAAANNPNRLLIWDSPCFVSSDCGPSLCPTTCSASHTCVVFPCPNNPTFVNGASSLSVATVLAVVLGLVALLW